MNKSFLKSVNPVKKFRFIIAFSNGVRFSFGNWVMLVAWLAVLILLFLFIKLGSERQLLLKETKAITGELSQSSLVLRDWERISNNISLSGDEFAGFEGLTAKLNIKTKQTGFRLAGKASLEGITRQDAEVVFENLSLNELINLLYQLEKGNFPLSLKTLQITSLDFEKDSLKVVIMFSSYKAAALRDSL